MTMVRGRDHRHTCYGFVRPAPRPFRGRPAHGWAILIVR